MELDIEQPIIVWNNSIVIELTIVDALTLTFLPPSDDKRKKLKD